MLTPDALATALPARTTLKTLEARLAVLDRLLDATAPARPAVTPSVNVVRFPSGVWAHLEPRPYAFGAPLAHALDWHAFGSAIFDTSTVLPNDSRWVNGGVL